MWSSSSSQESMEPQKPWDTGHVSCFGHMDICPLDTNWDKLVPQTVSSPEVLSWMALQATSYALSKKINSKFLFSHAMGSIQTHYVLGFIFFSLLKHLKKI